MLFLFERVFGLVQHARRLVEGNILYAQQFEHLEQRLARDHVVEVGHLASEKPGSSLHVIVALARHLAQAGYEWVVFTATRELVRLFTRLGLPLLALAKADPARLGDEAAAWGRYYDTQPVVVAGRIRLGLERVGA